MSQWTRLCELEIPCAVEQHIQNPTDQTFLLPAAVLNLEKRLGEPVKVHNDDKIRRQKLQQQKTNSSQSDSQPNGAKPGVQEKSHGVELDAALAKLSVDAAPSVSTRERSDIRKVKTTDLPELEHVFAEGLYFTLTDVVLLPCIHQYLVRKAIPTDCKASHCTREMDCRIYFLADETFEARREKLFLGILNNAGGFLVDLMKPVENTVDSLTTKTTIK